MVQGEDNSIILSLIKKESRFWYLRRSAIHRIFCFCFEILNLESSHTKSMERIRKSFSCPKRRRTRFLININGSDRRNCLRHCLSKSLLEMSHSLCRYHRSEILVNSERFSDCLGLNIWQNWSEMPAQKFGMK